MSSCVALAKLLAEQLHTDTLLRQLAVDIFGKPWAVKVGADRRKLLPDKLSPLLLVLPEGTREAEGPYAEHTLSIVTAVVWDSISDILPPLQEEVSLQVLDALSFLDEQTRPHVLHLVDSIPEKVTRAFWQSDINIEAFPLVIETLDITLHERLPIGGRLY